jgi:hypothetical protein
MKLIGTPQSTSAGQNRRTYSTILGNATSGDTVFQVTYEQGRVDVFLNGVRLVPDQDFTRTANGIGTFVTLVSGISTGDYVDLVGHVGLASNAVRTDNFVVGTSSTGSGGSYTGSTTVFPVLSSGGDKVNFYLNGVLLDSTDYTVSSSGSTVTLSAAAATSDIVEIQVIGALVSSSSATFDSLALTGSLTSGTLESGVTFPAGHVIKTLVFESQTAVTNEVDQFLPINSTSLSVQVPNYTYGNTLLIWAVAFVIVQENAGMVRCSGYYKTGGSLGSPATPSTGTWTTTGYIGYRKTSANTFVTADEDTLTMLDSIELSGSGTTHLDYAIYADFGASSSEVTTYKKRIFIQEIQG